MNMIKEWWNSMSDLSRVHLLYGLALAALLLFMGFMQALHHAEVTRLKAAAEMSEQKALEAIHAAKAAEQERAQAAAVSAAQTANAAATRHIGEAVQAQAAANLKNTAVKQTSNWDELNKMAGIR